MKVLACSLTLLGVTVFSSAALGKQVKIGFFLSNLQEERCQKDKAHFEAKAKSSYRKEKRLRQYSL